MFGIVGERPTCALVTVFASWHFSLEWIYENIHEHKSMLFNMDPAWERQRTSLQCAEVKDTLVMPTHVQWNWSSGVVHLTVACEKPRLHYTASKFVERLCKSTYNFSMDSLPSLSRASINCPAKTLRNTMLHQTIPLNKIKLSRFLLECIDFAVVTKFVDDLKLGVALQAYAVAVLYCNSRNLWHLRDCTRSRSLCCKMTLAAELCILHAYLSNCLSKQYVSLSRYQFSYTKE